MRRPILPRARSGSLLLWLRAKRDCLPVAGVGIARHVLPASWARLATGRHRTELEALELAAAGYPAR